jgi:hypothetical protein
MIFHDVIIEDLVPLDMGHMGLIINIKPWDYISKGLFP